MTHYECLALAMLRGGCSYDDAATATKLPLDHVMRLWRASDAQNN